MLAAYNQETGDFAFMSVGPQVPRDPGALFHPFSGVLGTSASPFSRFMANTIGAGSFANVHNGIDFGRPRYPTNTFDWIILMLNSAPEGTVRTREEYWIRCEKHPDTSDCKTGSSTPN